MGKAKKYTKYIFCLESDFDNNLEKDWTSIYTLDQIKNLHNNKLKYIHRKFATKESYVTS